MMTRPWSALKTYRRVAAKGPIWWREDISTENNVHGVIGKEDYFLSALQGRVSASSITVISS